MNREAIYIILTAIAAFIGMYLQLSSNLDVGLFGRILGGTALALLIIQVFSIANERAKPNGRAQLSKIGQPAAPKQPGFQPRK